MGEITRTVHTMGAVESALSWTKENVEVGVTRGAVLITLGRPLRTLSQNAKLWPMLGDIESQMTWYTRKLTKTQWKHLITAAWRELDCVPSISGTGVVMFGIETSKLNKADFSDLIECIYAFGSERGVEWSEKSESIYQEYKK